MPSLPTPRHSAGHGSRLDQRHLRRASACVADRCAVSPLAGRGGRGAVSHPHAGRCARGDGRRAGRAGRAGTGADRRSRDRLAAGNGGGRSMGCGGGRLGRAGRARRTGADRGAGRATQAAGTAADVAGDPRSPMVAARRCGAGRGGDGRGRIAVRCAGAAAASGHAGDVRGPLARPADRDRSCRETPAAGRCRLGGGDGGAGRAAERLVQAVGVAHRTGAGRRSGGVGRGGRPGDGVVRRSGVVGQRLARAVGGG